jgi:hypothetical protein
MLLYSNSRITDTKETLRAEMKALAAKLAAGFARMSSEIQSLKAELKIHQLAHHRN